MSNYFTDYAAKFGGMGFAYDLTWIGEQLVDHRRLMQHWHSVFPSDLLEVDYDALVEDVEGWAMPTKRKHCASAAQERSPLRLRPEAVALGAGGRVGTETQENLANPCGGERIDEPNAAEDFSGVHVFAQQHAATGGLRTGKHDSVVKRNTAGLLQVEPRADDGRCHLNDFKLLVKVELRPDMLRRQLELLQSDVAILLQHLGGQHAARAFVELLEQRKCRLLLCRYVACFGVDEDIGVDKAALGHAVNARWLRRD